MESKVRGAPGVVVLGGTQVIHDTLPERDVRLVVVQSQIFPEPRSTVLPRLRRFAPLLRHEGAALFCFDYQGRGDSTGAPDSAAVDSDRAAVEAFLRQRFPGASIVFRGHPTPRSAWALHRVRIPPGATLPLFEYPAASPSRGTVLFTSSSPEWAPLHDALSLRLAAAGYAVVGVSSVEVPERICALTGVPFTVDEFLSAYEVIAPTAQAIARDDRPLLLLGHSAGSSGNLLLAAFAGPDSPRMALRGRVRGVVGFGNSGNQGFSRGFFGSVEPSEWRLEPLLPRVTVPVALYQGDLDPLPPSQLEPLLRHLPQPPHSEVVPGADHDFTGRFEELVGRVLEGLRRAGDCSR